MTIEGWLVVGVEVRRLILDEQEARDLAARFGGAVLPLTRATNASEAEPVAVKADYFGELVDKARAAAAKASVKFPQPNYVTLKIAEEAGEVVRGAVHYAEGRMEWGEVEGEIVQLLAMLIRFVTEGDEINGVRPPALAKSRKAGESGNSCTVAVPPQAIGSDDVRRSLRSLRQEARRRLRRH